MVISGAFAGVVFQLIATVEVLGDIPSNVVGNYVGSSRVLGSVVSYIKHQIIEDDKLLSFLNPVLELFGAHHF